MPPSPHLPTIALIGRTNVGKSSLFNRLTESRHAIVAPEAGTTRDRTYGICRWRGRPFRLIDTGGVDVATVRDSVRLLLHPKPQSSVDPLGAAIIRQTKTAIAEADLLLMVVDGKAGVLPQDRQLARVAQRLAQARASGRSGGKIVLLACNKLDRPAGREQTVAFQHLGLGEAWPVSAKNGLGTGELLDAIANALPDAPAWGEATPAPGEIRLGLLGKPNVGKSSLLNRLVGAERAVVSPTPLTTREAQETPFQSGDRRFVLVDTAGIKPWRKTASGVAAIAQQQSLAALKRLDIALLLVDAQEPVSHQDQALASLITESQAGGIIVVNKWDLVEAGANSLRAKNVAAYYRTRLPAMAWTPVIALSALTGQNVANVLDLTVSVWERRQRQLPAAALGELLSYAAKRQRPRGTGIGAAGQPGAQRPRLISLEQTGTNPPTFTLRIGRRQSLHPTYRRFLERLLTERFQLEGANAKLYVQQLRQNHRRAR